MSEQLQGILLTALGVVLVAIIAQIGSIIIKKMRPTLTQPEMWERIDELTRVIYGDGKNELGLLKRVTLAEQRADEEERRRMEVTSALGRIIRDLAKQWVGAPPRLNPDDLKLLDELYIPAEHPWRQKPSDTKER